jgi:modulator of FtsH protease HflK
VELSVAVHYQVTDPFKALFGVRDPERTLGDVSESVILEVVGRSTLEQVLAGGTRPQITQRAQQLIQRTLEGYGAGITVTSVNLVDVQVPEAVRDAQHDANRALAEQERSIKAAQADANSILPLAQGRAAALQEQAQAYRTQVLEAARAQAASFSQILDAYNEAPAVTRRRMYMDAIEAILARARKVVIDAAPARGGGSSNLIYLPLDKLLEKAAAQAPPPVRPEPRTEPEPGVTVEGPHPRGER